MRKLAFALAVPALIAAAPALAGPFGGVHVAVNRHEYRGNACPIEVVFTASVNITNDHGPGLVFNYHWERSDGAKGPEVVIKPGSGARTKIIQARWKLGKRGETYDISNTIHLNSGNEHISESSPTVHIECH